MAHYTYFAAQTRNTRKGNDYIEVQ